MIPLKDGRLNFSGPERVSWFAMRKKLLVGAGTAFVALVLIYASRFYWLAGVYNVLVIDDQLKPSDIIFVLNGDTTVRPLMASQLYKRQLAPKVVMARAEDSIAVQMGAYPNVTDSNITALTSLGVPESSIEQVRVPGGVTSTFDEARALHQFIAEHHARRVIVVTNELHSRRAKFIMQRLLGDVEVLIAPIPDRKYGAQDWWKKEDGLIGCQNEYIKLLFYYFKY